MSHRTIQKLTYLLALIALNLISLSESAAATCPDGVASISLDCDDLTVNGTPSVTVESLITILSTNKTNSLNGSILSFTNNGSILSNQDFASGLENNGSVTSLINNHIFSGYNNGSAYGSGITNISTGTIADLINRSSGTMTGDRGINNGGIINNLVNDGTISGVYALANNVTSDSSPSQIDVLTNGASGLINGIEKGIANFGSMGTIYNYGYVTSNEIGIYNQGGTISGGITNAPGARISGATVAIQIQSSSLIGGGITNLGEIRGTSYGIFVYSQSLLNGGIYNSDSAVIEGTGTNSSVAINIGDHSTLNGGIHNTNYSSISASQAIQITLSTLNGGIHNSDNSEILANGDEAAAIYLYDSTLNGGINNSGSGKIRATQIAGNAISINNSTLTGGIHNSDSEIVASGNESAAIYLSNSTLNGGINNSGSGKIRATGVATYPIFINAIYMNSSTLNDGINNSGTISADNASNGRGILIERSSTLNGGISNSGTIYGSYSGIRIDNSLFDGGINNSETGIIRASGLGIHIVQSSVYGGINNAGTINAIAIEGSIFSGGINNAGTIDTNGIQINSSQFTGGINNSGTISAPDYGSAISTYNYSSDPSSIDAITNGVTGVISASNSFSNGIYNYGTTIGTITNLGSISGDKGISNIGGGAIINTLNNSGTISGLNTAIYNDAGSAIGTLTNTGTISGGSYGVFNDYATITSLINSGTISSANGDAINTYNDTTDITSLGVPSISTLTNTGTISSLDNGYDINTEWGSIGTIGTLNNLQGVGNAAGPLTYNGYLPTNYNIIINRANYGQLVTTNNFSSTTNFGISSLSGKITQLTYSGVMSGVTSVNFTNYQSAGTSWGKYLGVDWQLLETSASIWDLNFFSLPIYGPSAADTQSSMQYQSRQLRSAFNTQTVAANFGLNYDCNVFDKKGMCISAGGRYTTIDNPNINNSAAVVTLGYKVNPNIRIGAYLDQNINTSKPTGISFSNNSPLMGAYAVWNKEQSGLGYQVRLANTYQDKDVTSTRTVFDTSEAGSGRSSLQSQSYLAELSYAFQYQDKTLVRPYAGLRYTHLKQKGYTEDTTDSVTDPLTFAALRDRSATALLGVKINRHLTDKATLTAQLGLEQDLHHKVDNYSATDLNGSDLTAVAFNSNIKRTRPVASLGAFYDVTKTQRASASINYQQTPFQSTGSTTAYFNYMIGF